MEQGPETPRGPNSRIIKAVFAGAALISVVTGLVVYLLADRIGLDETTAHIVAMVFLFVGATDYLLLHFWDRIFRRPGNGSPPE